MRHRRPCLIRTVAIAVAFAYALGASSSAQSQRSFLWKVEGGARVLYLAGSIHALPADVYPLPSAYQRAFEASGTLVEEIDLQEADPLSSLPMLMTKGMYRDGRTFSQAVSPQTAARVAERLSTVPGMMALLQPMEPWVVTLMLTAVQVQNAGLDVSLGLDKHFYDRAKEGGKPVIGLETAESQIDRFDRMPERLQEQMLLSALEDMSAGEAELRQIVTAWRNGDAATMEKKMLDGLRTTPDVYTSLIVERNHNWMPQIEACFTKPQPCLVVVGAAHLVGPDGLLALLSSRGYRIEQM